MSDHFLPPNWREEDLKSVKVNINLLNLRDWLFQFWNSAQPENPKQSKAQLDIQLLSEYHPDWKSKADEVNLE